MGKKEPLLPPLVAYLRAERGIRNQGTIARVIKYTESYVSKLMGKAEDEGYLRISAQFLKKDLTPEQLNALEELSMDSDLCKDLGNAAIKKGGKPVRRVIRFDSGGYGQESSHIGQRQAYFGEHAAKSVLELIAKSRRVGVAWGHTLMHVVSAMRKIPSQVCENPPQFLPVRGDPLGMIDARSSPSVLAAELSLLMSGSTDHSLTLSGVPALIPIIPDMDEDAFKKYVELSPAFTKIFGTQHSGSSPSRLIDSVDCILTSAATHQSFGALSEEYIRSWGIDRTFLEETVIGDIAGIYLPREGLQPHQLHQIQQFSNRWLGIQLDDLKRCVKKAEKDDTPGVVLVAIGREKAPIVYKCCVELGVVSELIIDYDLSEELEKLLA